ncbi:hypothetical protein [Actinomadura rupiterrae]|uniref:hypothetical protein n=1 Tax=Actinomadura rupiterrae TaxID=559627 RepID=UPI0020A4A486|nr:hypothetical protein [Actinomadura rupiterrae]MCP2339827.1 hypothetical protein [Actinomadura rupiterrae]
MTQRVRLTAKQQEAQEHELGREFPGWSIICARDTGRWWALRGPGPGEVVQHGASAAEADTPEGLRDQLRAYAREEDR